MTENQPNRIKAKAVKVKATAKPAVKPSPKPTPKPAPAPTAPKPNPVSPAQPTTPVNNGGGVLTPSGFIAAAKLILKIKIAASNAVGADKVEILRFEISDTAYYHALENPKETLADLSSRACEGYITEKTKVVPEYFMDENEKFIIYILTTDKMRKSYVSAFINGDGNLTAETLKRLNEVTF